MSYQILQWSQIASQYKSGTILLGNGASIAACKNFRYRALLDNARQSGLLEGDVASLFKFFGTDDFELILRLVWQANNVNKSLSIADDRTRQAYLCVRDCLIKSVREVHPEYAQIEHHLPNMYQFLKTFETVISLNYDLLVYWTMTYGLKTHDGHLFKDCFQGDRSFDGSWKKYRDCLYEKANTLVFYPHGSLALCRNKVEQESKIHSGEASLLEAILKAWRSEEYVPLFVSEGTMEQKLSSIQSSYYLSTVYREVLSTYRHKLTLYGWGLGKHDRHLLEGMRGSGIKQVAVSVFGDDQGYCNHAYQAIRQCLGQIKVNFFNSESPGCWLHAGSTDQLGDFPR